VDELNYGRGLWLATISNPSALKEPAKMPNCRMKLRSEGRLADRICFFTSSC
jgi:hypothetical protein